MDVWNGPLDGLDDGHWVRLGLNPAIPRLLRETMADPARRTHALLELSDLILPESEPNFATGPATEYLARMAVHPGAEGRVDLLRGLIAILETVLERGRSSPEDRFNEASVLRSIEPYAARIMTLADAETADEVRDFSQGWMSDLRIQKQPPA